MVEDILDLEDTIQRLIADLELRHGVAVTHLSIIRDDQQASPVGNLEVKAQWLVASKIDR